MKKFWITLLIVCTLLLSSCSEYVGSSLDSENSSIGDDMDTLPLDRGDITGGDDYVPSDKLEKYTTSEWEISYSSGNFFIQSSTDNSVVLSLVDEVYKNDNDKSVYLSISYYGNISAEDAAEREMLETQPLLDAAEFEVATRSSAVVNGMNVQHIQTTWGNLPYSTIYDVYYVDTEDQNHCYILTLCYYRSAVDTWGSEMQKMANSFTFL